MKTKKPIKIEDIYDHDWWYPAGEDPVSFNFTYASHLFYETVDDERVPVEFDIFPSTVFFMNRLLYKYEDRYVFVNSAAETAADLNMALFNIIQEFYDGIGANLADVIGSLQMEYNPIHNYDGTETRTIDHDNSYGRTDTNTHTHEDDKVKTTNKYYGVEGVATPANVDTAETEKTGSDIMTNVQSGEDGFEETETLVRGGNLGQTMTQTMLENEMRLRMKDIYDKFLKLFIDEYTFYM